MDFFMAFLAYLHTFVHSIFLWIWNLFKEDGFVDDWQTLIGSFLGAFFTLLAWYIGYEIQKWIDRKEKRKGAIQLADIYLTQSYNNSLMTIMQMEAFLKRIQERIFEVEQINDDINYFTRSTNFPPVANIRFYEDLLKPWIGSYYLHNKIMSAEHIIAFTNAAIKKFDTDFSNLLSRCEANKKEKINPRQQRFEYDWDLKWYSGMVLAVIKDLKTTGLKLLIQARQYNRKLMKDYKQTKKYYEPEEMDLKKMEKIDQLIDTEVQEILNSNNA